MIKADWNPKGYLPLTEPQLENIRIDFRCMRYDLLTSIRNVAQLLATVEELQEVIKSLMEEKGEV